MSVSSITEYISYFEAGEDMTDEEYGLYMRTIHNFAFCDIEPDYTQLPPLVKAALRTIIASIRKNKADKEAGSLGGAPTGNKNAKKNNSKTTEKTTSETSKTTPIVSEKQPPCFQKNNPSCFSETTKEKEKEKEKENENLNSVAATAASEKQPLQNSEPQNDLEQVENLYLENYNTLYKKGVLRLEKPIINWGQCRKLERDKIDNYGLEAILLAIEHSVNNDFCIQKGYSLSTILSAGVLSELINGNAYSQKQSVMQSVDETDMEDILF